jgi:hypothetical protein
MLTIITPCSRQHNIPKISNSIKFNKIHKWIIVYDTSKDRTYNKLYKNHPKILEVECNDGISGNPQRNYGMSLVDDGWIYFLDDDNIIHPKFWSIFNKLNCSKFYTFDQARDKQGGVLPGHTIALNHIDTAMFIVHKKHIGNIKWHNDRYNADGYFICDINENNKDAHIYINDIAAYYNFLE